MKPRSRTLKARAQGATAAARRSEALARALQLCRDYAANEKIDRRYLGELIEAAAGSALQSTARVAEGHDPHALPDDNDEVAEAMNDVHSTELRK